MYPATTSKRGLYLIIGLILLVLVGSGVFLFLTLQGSKEDSSLTNSEEVTPQTTVSTSPTTSNKALTKLTGAVWLEKPEVLADLKLFKTGKEQDVILLHEGAKFSYKKVATFPDQSILILANIPVYSRSGSMLVHIIKNKDGSYFLLTDRFDSWPSKEDWEKAFNPGVTIKEAEVAELDYPGVLTAGSNKFTQGYFVNQTFDELKQPKKIATSDYGAVYQVNTEISGDLRTRSIYLALRDTTIVSYTVPVDFYKDDRIPTITLNSKPGQKNTTEFTQGIVMSCGGLYGSVPVIPNNSALLSGQSEIGKTSSGSPIYQLMSPTNELVKYIYSNYSVGRDSGSAESIETMASKFNHFLWEDSLGDWQVFVSTDYTGLAECGKPVIYLYPTNQTEVNVQVGAQITKSEPTYPEGGWTVTANPDGKLNLNNQKYDYLFWEGLGNGPYPELRDSGFVVSQNDIPETLKKHLNLLGLNEKESSDFMDFWLPKMPQTPYVRLTWFGTKEMNSLATLKVTPRPDTTIRIFLDFEGLEAPVKLNPQTLTTVKRSGFTLVEWGGLLVHPR